MQKTRPRLDPTHTPPSELSGPPLVLPHTSAEKAALCDGLTPFLEGLTEALATRAGKHPFSPAGPQALFMASLLHAEIARLLRGEPMGHYLAPPPQNPEISFNDLHLMLVGLASAITAFRRRYHGWHPALRAPAWHICGPFGIEDARQLQPRERTDEPVRNPRNDDIRRKLIERIEQLKRRDPEPIPLHRTAPEPNETIEPLTSCPGV